MSRVNAYLDRHIGQCACAIAALYVIVLMLDGAP